MSRRKSGKDMDLLRIDEERSDEALDDARNRVTLTDVKDVTE